MTAARAIRRLAGLAALALIAACASSPPRREAPRARERDRTQDPEFRAAVEAAEREFATQADALASGVYEPFVHPDSIQAPPPAATRRAPAADPVFAEDPTTEELLATLRPGTPGSPEPYNRTPEPYHRTPDRSADEAQPPPSSGAAFTLQVGAFGAESGALVRLRQLARDFPDWPRWHSARGGVVRVYVGRFGDRAAAERARDEAAARGYADAWIVAAP